MIELINLSKQFWTKDGPKVVARDITATFPAGVSVALLGRNGAGKSTLMDMIGGTSKPDSGTIKITGSMSWPVGFSGSFHRDLTGAQNTRFIARVYGAFKRKSRLVFQDRMRTAGAVVVTHYMSQVRQLCRAGAVLEDGVLTYYDDVEEAIAHHHDNMGADDDI